MGYHKSGIIQDIADQIYRSTDHVYCLEEKLHGIIDMLPILGIENPKIKPHYSVWSNGVIW